MDDVIAVRVLLESGDKRYFLTWGRVYDAVDSSAVEEAILRSASKFALGGSPVSATVCESLGEAANQPFFYEAFFAMAHKPIPFGAGYTIWAGRMRKAIDRGKEIYYLGAPASPVSTPPGDRPGGRKPRGS
jgi:hypothetical protein